MARLLADPDPGSVGRRPRIPAELKLRPFSLDEAREAGLSLRSLSGRSWRRVATRLYRWSDLPDDPWLMLSAWRRLLPPDAVFAGATAAWLLGLHLEPTDPVEVVVPPSSGVRTRAGLVVRHRALASSDVATIRGLPVLVLPLTLAGLCLDRPAVEALVAIDIAVRRGLTDAKSLAGYADAARGRPGMNRLRILAPLAARAESPMETRLRWLLIQSGLPRPVVQANLCDAASRFVGRADLYYPSARLVLEFDGGNHRDRLVEDDRRQNLLVNAGYRLLRFTTADVLGRPDLVVAQVRGALGPQFIRSAQDARFPWTKGTVLHRTHRMVPRAGGLATARSGCG